MLQTYAASAIATDIRASTDHDSDTQVTDAQLWPWISSSYHVLRRKIADIAPELFTGISADLTVAAGASTIALSSITDLGKIRTVERKDGSVYTALPLAPFEHGSHPAHLSWRLRAAVGADVVDLAPADLAPGTYRVRYLTKGVAINDSGDNLILPEGGDRVVVEEVAARVRVRFEEDPTPHLVAAKAAWEELRQGLVRLYANTSIPIVDVRGWGVW